MPTQRGMEPVQVADGPARPAFGPDSDRPIRANNVMDEQFPTDNLTAHDARDEMMDARLQLQQGMGQGVTPFGVMTASDSDFEWLRAKFKAEEYANFQQWFAQEFDRMRPADKAVARRLFPRFYAERKRTLDQNAENLKRAATIKLFGVRNADDLMFQYAMETGRVDTSQLENIMFPERAPQNKQKRWQRGLLNPRRFVFGDQGTDEGSLGDGRAANSKRWVGETDARSRALGLTAGVPPMDATVDTQRIRDWATNNNVGIIRQ